jgi:hypothetical protein
VNSRLSEIALQVVAPHRQHTRSEATGGGRFNPFWLVRSPPEGIDRVGVKRLLSGISTFLFGILWFAGVILLLIGALKLEGTSSRGLPFRCDFAFNRPPDLPFALDLSENSRVGRTWNLFLILAAWHGRARPAARRSTELIGLKKGEVYTGSNW